LLQVSKSCFRIKLLFKYKTLQIWKGVFFSAATIDIEPLSIINYKNWIKVATTKSFNLKFTPYNQDLKHIF
jgi:hypothetical protein